MVPPELQREYVRRPSQPEKFAALRAASFMRYDLPEKCLTLARRFCILYTNLALWASWKDNRIRAMRSYQSYFAFTYRFSWWGKRPGETRADESSK
jgi:hypothetical protein